MFLCLTVVTHFISVQTIQAELVYFGDKDWAYILDGIFCSLVLL